MSNVDYKKRAIILSFICAIVIIALVMTFISLIQSLKDEDTIPQEKHIYATVMEKGNNYIRVSEIDSNNSYLFKTKDSYDKGDLVSIEYIDDNDDLTTKNIDIVAKKEELDALEDTDEKTTTTSVSSTTSVITSSSVSSTRKNNTTSSTKRVTTNVANSSNDDAVIDFVKKEYDSYSNYAEKKSIPERAKEGFITIIDFIFYDGTIKGKRFDELTASAKAKVIYYALLIDGKIDDKWPNYKETIKNKAKDLKAKLLAKYMDITSSLCSDHPDACKVANDDFKILKKSLSITWKVVVDAAKYGYGKASTILKNWYETWRSNA